MKGFAVALTVLTLCAIAFVPSASASYSTGFESPTFTGSPAGTVLTGQDGFYLPSPANDTDLMVYTYAGNPLGIPVNPDGGDQFVAGTGPGNEIHARAQRDVTFTGGTWTITYDIAAAYLGSAPASQFLGSFSPQPFTYVQLCSWVDYDDPVSWNASYMAFDAAGTQFTAPGASPGAAWENLDLEHWYRMSTTLDLDANLITEVSILDLETAVGTTFSPVGWYLAGGAGGPPAPLTGFRLFAGGNDPGNVMAFDNLSIVPEPSTLVLVALGALGLPFSARLRRMRRLRGPR